MKTNQYILKFKQIGDSVMKILVIDDLEKNRVSAQKTLGRNHSVTVASSYKDGKAFILEKKFDVILTDLHMPGKGKLKDGNIGEKDEMPMGLYIMFIAARRKIPLVAIGSDGDFHGHPFETGLAKGKLSFEITHIGAKVPSSTIVFMNPSMPITPEGGKDWGLLLKQLLEFKNNSYLKNY